VSAGRQRLATRDRRAVLVLVLVGRMLLPDWRYSDPFKSVIDRIDTVLYGKDDEE
jgi:hypothetical protein